MMTTDEAIRILDPTTTLEALGEYEYYGGFNGQEAKVEACNEACRVACTALRRTSLLDNKTLTVDELHEMVGEPVWVVSTEISAKTGWYLVGKYYDETICMHCADNTLYEKGLWRGSFVAYRRPPEKGE